MQVGGNDSKLSLADYHARVPLTGMLLAGQVC